MFFLSSKVLEALEHPFQSFGRDTHRDDLKFFGAIKWLPFIPGSSSATERYPNFLLSHFPPLAQGPSTYNSGAHAAFPVTSHSVFLWKCLDVFFEPLP